MLRALDRLAAAAAAGRKEQQHQQQLQYCEVGMSGGHSAAAVLAARPLVSVLAFDTATFPFSADIVAHLRATYGDRFQFVGGHSLSSIPAFVRASGGRFECDVTFIDGGHSLEVVQSDITWLRQLAAQRHVLFFDDSAEYRTLQSRVSCAYDCITCNGISFPASAVRFAGPSPALVDTS